MRSRYKRRRANTPLSHIQNGNIQLIIFKISPVTLKMVQGHPELAWWHKAWDRQRLLYHLVLNNIIISYKLPTLSFCDKAGNASITSTLTYRVHDHVIILVSHWYKRWARLMIKTCGENNCQFHRSNVTEVRSRSPKWTWKCLKLSEQYRHEI